MTYNFDPDSDSEKINLNNPTTQQLRPPEP